MYKALIVHRSAICRNELNKLVSAQQDLTTHMVVEDIAHAFTVIDKSMPDLVLLQIDDAQDQIEKLLSQVQQSHRHIIAIYHKLENSDVMVQKAISMGVRDFIALPCKDYQQCFSELAPKIQKMLANMVELISKRLERSSSKHKHLIALGTSMGGTKATEMLLQKLPASIAGMVIVQHMKAKMLPQYAAHLNNVGSLRVKLAEHNEPVLPGKVLIAPADMHTRVIRKNNQYLIQLQSGPPIGHHLPAVEALFSSVAECAGADALGIILTGMGEDGALGITRMHKQGALTIAQDEASCAVFGMPKAAILYGGIDQVLPLQEIPAAIVKYASNN